MAPSILITGGTGFLGSLIVDAICEKHPEWIITVLDVQPPRESRPDITFIHGDITSVSDIEDVIRKTQPKVIIHSASLVPPLKHRFGRQLESLVLSINVDGTRKLLSAAKANGVSSFIYTSSCTVIIDDTRHQYRNINESYPTSTSSLIYGESKALAESLVLSANDPSEDFLTCALRPSVLFGPGDPQLVPSIHACIAKGETPFILGGGSNLWDVSYAPNIADAHVLAVENLSTSKTAAGEAFFIQNNEPVAFRDLCLEVWRQFGHYPPFEVRIPVGLAWAAGWVGEWVTWITGEVVTLSRGSVMDACAIRYASGEKASRVLGYEAKVGIEEGIRITCQDYEKRLEAQKDLKSSEEKVWSDNTAITHVLMGWRLLRAK